MKQSSFRTFVYNKWFEYKDEVETWEKRRVEGNPEEYFNKYKYFLKAKYRQENK
jgi:hypothetical protein